MDALLPVPVHIGRRLERGYNQAEVLALRLGKHLNLPVRTDLLFRSRKTVASKKLGDLERIRNLRSAFSARGDFGGLRRICIIDDILTTGATVEALACLLKEQGVEEVYYLVIAV